MPAWTSSKVVFFQFFEVQNFDMLEVILSRLLKDYSIQITNLQY